VACWLWLFDQMRRISEAFGDAIPGVILLIAVVVAAFARFQSLRKSSRSEENDKN